MQHSPLTPLLQRAPRAVAALSLALGVALGLAACDPPLSALPAAEKPRQVEDVPMVSQQESQQESQQGSQEESPTERSPTPEATMQGGLDAYNFLEPDEVWELPEELLEVSGIAFTGPAALACVQDELGSLFTLDLGADGSLSRKKFGPKGDYEGLDRADADLALLRSDGALLRLNLEGEPRGEFISPLESTPYEEFESVAFEAARNRWLVLPKDTSADGEHKKDDRVIFALDRTTLALADQPALVLSRKKIIKEAAKLGWPLPTRLNKKGKQKSAFVLRPSDLVVSPITGDYFILSGKDRTLVAVTPSGELLGTAVFPTSVLIQPEALAFQANGDLFIASEGVPPSDPKNDTSGSDESAEPLAASEVIGRPAVLLRFNYRPK